MIPSGNTILTTDLEVETIPSKNYKMQIEKNFISGYCDEIDAVKQAIYKILNTERYEYIIYSWNYGIETMDLYGEPVDWVCSELERRITDALSVDDRIETIGDFNFDTSERGVILVTFTVNTIFGDTEVEKVVNY